MAPNGITSRFDRRSAAVSVCVCLWAAGCAGLLKETPIAKAYFAIDPGRPETRERSAATTPSTLEVLRVRTLRVSPPYDGTAFVYRIGPSQFDTDYYNNFIAPPASLLTGALIQWLARSETATVCDASSDLRSNVTLEGNITALYIDSTATPSPRAVVAGRFFLTRDRNAVTELLFQKTYEGSAAVTVRTPAGFSSAWGNAYRQVLAALAADVNSNLPSP